MTDQPLELPEALSRRDFVKMSALAWLGMGLPVNWRRTSFGLESPALGRVASPTAEVYREPSFASRRVETLWRDDVVELAGAALGGPQPEHNRVWYEVDHKGFVHSSSIQPVEDQPNEPLTFVPHRGWLMEVTVPFVDAFWKPRSDAEKAYRFYYSTTHWVTGVSRDVRGDLWYRIADDKYTYTYYAPATGFRPVPVAELAPISNHVPSDEKRIEVDLARQWVRCYESDREVFTTKIASGRYFSDGSYWTPTGDFVTFRKRPSRHMASGNRATGYDLPGVPWVCYFTENGVAFHGTYWHNDFGAPQSHGCINMTPQASKWLYRWSRPVVPAKDDEVWVSYGSQVRVHA
ncbi:MAG: L,D-transpeptidase [Anaerolineales bacterium]|nr:L,D-transpeptidase [Anaerolineales bacterium]